MPAPFFGGLLILLLVKHKKIFKRPKLVTWATVWMPWYRLTTPVYWVVLLSLTRQQNHMLCFPPSDAQLGLYCSHLLLLLVCGSLPSLLYLITEKHALGADKWLTWTLKSIPFLCLEKLTSHNTGWVWAAIMALHTPEFIHSHHQ